MHIKETEILSVMAGLDKLRFHLLEEETEEQTPVV